jgi:hypothetical protein
MLLSLQIMHLSPNSHLRSDEAVEKKIGMLKEKIEISCPEAVANYSCSMGGSGFE